MHWVIFFIFWSRFGSFVALVSSRPCPVLPRLKAQHVVRCFSFLWLSKCSSSSLIVFNETIVWPDHLLLYGLVSVLVWSWNPATQTAWRTFKARGWLLFSWLIAGSSCLMLLRYVVGFLLLLLWLFIPGKIKKIHKNTENWKGVLCGCCYSLHLVGALLVGCECLLWAPARILLNYSAVFISFSVWVYLVSADRHTCGPHPESERTICTSGFCYFSVSALIFSNRFIVVLGNNTYTKVDYMERQHYLIVLQTISGLAPPTNISSITC